MKLTIEWAKGATTAIENQQYRITDSMWQMVQDGKQHELIMSIMEMERLLKQVKKEVLSVE